MNHGDAEHVQGAAPSTRQVCANVLLVHKGKIFEMKDVWLYVYDGALPDVMLSETFLNNIPCISHPGTKLLDTVERAGDQQLLQQCIEDYAGLVARRFTHPEYATSNLHLAARQATVANLMQSEVGQRDAVQCNKDAQHGDAQSRNAQTAMSANDVGVNLQPSSVYAVVMVKKPGQPGKWRLCLDLQPFAATMSCCTRIT
jgi:hypothetical protein